MPSLVHGSCLCGAISFSAHMPALWVAHCHCTRCQRAHGAAFVTWVGMKAENVTLDDERHALRWYQNADAQRGFCSTCGSPMFFKSANYPGELHIARSLFQEPLEQQPQTNVYFNSRVIWGCSPDRLPVEPEPESRS